MPGSPLSQAPSTSLRQISGALARAGVSVTGSTCVAPVRGFTRS